MNYDASTHPRQSLSSRHVMNPEPRQSHVPCPDAAGGHRMAYVEWGDPASAHVVVCVHGLSRQGRDFDVLARALVGQAAGGIRVVCPDVVGRGRSDWLADPSGYQVPLYAADMVALLAQLHTQAPIATLDWVGTSMGGLIGMIVAGQPGLPLPAPVRRLVLNDVGPAIRWEAIERIGTYLGQTGDFAGVQEAADAMRAVSAGFGPHTDAEWLELSRPMVRPLAGRPGRFTLHYDPAIGVPFRALRREMAEQGEALLWQMYDGIRARTLLLRGAQSDLLSRETAQAMTQRGPCASLIEFEGVGHAPTLIDAGQVRAVTSFLLGP